MFLGADEIDESGLKGFSALKTPNGDVIGLMNSPV